MASMKLLSVNVGLPREIEWQGTKYINPQLGRPTPSLAAAIIFRSDLLYRLGNC